MHLQLKRGPACIGRAGRTSMPIESPLTRRAFMTATAALGAGLAAPSFAQQAYPARPVHLIVPYAAGGGTDFFARLCDVDPSGKSTNICDGLLHLGGRVVVPAEAVLDAEHARHGDGHHRCEGLGRPRPAPPEAGWCRVRRGQVRHAHPRLPPQVQLFGRRGLLWPFLVFALHHKGPGDRLGGSARSALPVQLCSFETRRRTASLAVISPSSR